ncbi:PIN domain-containing protein [uncultured Polaribacter sp.]|uniref:PIN domain-containing protein n=1 Tax=uncultured Polaribacter sp. TaxID=174711 RepID=UPI00261EE092|nr:PIN domain-containing protein [uncultured Polaribacter sp.]
MATQLFIDTNVYLKFYHFSNDDLEELNKLMVLIDNDKLELHLPEQIVDEFNRNRDTKVADALKTLNQSKLNAQFPQFCKEYKEYETLKKLIKDYDREKQALLKNLMLKIETNTLRADKLTEMLFNKANYLKTTSELVEKSRLRYDIGNPPGKNKSYGDAINWECLIENVENNNDLYFIADDKDYFSELDNSKFNTFLSNEWYRKKNSRIKFYKTLTQFFKEVFPEIKLATELEKEILISKLIDSGNFYSSRETLQKLSKFESFSTEQANQYVSASLNNTQIYWISDDEDINEYLYEFVNKNKEKIDIELLAEFYSKISNLKVPSPPE